MSRYTLYGRKQIIGYPKERFNAIIKVCHMQTLKYAEKKTDSAVNADTNVLSKRGLDYQ